MKGHVQFINLEEDEKDIIISFAITDAKTGIKSLLLHRQLFFEHILEDDEKGVVVSLEGDNFNCESADALKEIRITNNEIHIVSTRREYVLDVSNVDDKEIKGMVTLLYRQNYDNRFTVKIA